MLTITIKPNNTLNSRETCRFCGLLFHSANHLFHLTEGAQALGVTCYECAYATLEQQAALAV